MAVHDARGQSGRSSEALRDPQFDERLTRDAKAAGLAVEGLDDPRREIDIDGLELRVGTARLAPVDIAGDISARVEFLIKITRFHKLQSRRCTTAFSRHGRACPGHPRRTAHA